MNSMVVAFSMLPKSKRQIITNVFMESVTASVRPGTPTRDHLVIRIVALTFQIRDFRS